MTDHVGQWGQIKGSIWPRPVRRSVTGVRGQILWSLYSKSSIATQNPKLMQSVQIDRRQGPGDKSPSRSDLIVKSNAHWSGETSLTGEGNWQLIFQDTSLTSDTWTSVTVEINLCDYLLGTRGASLISWTPKHVQHGVFMSLASTCTDFQIPWHTTKWHYHNLFC